MLRLDTNSVLEAIKHLTVKYNLHVKNRLQAQTKILGKLCKLNAAAKKACKSGSYCLQKLFNKWKSQEFTITIHSHEINHDSLLQENKQLKSERKQFKTQLSVALKKVQHLTITHANVRKQKQRIAQKLLSKDMRKKKRKIKGKSFLNYSERQKNRIRSEIMNESQISLEFLDMYDFMATTVEIFNHSTGLTESINLMGDLYSPDEPKLLDNDLLKNTLYAKEKCNVSDSGYKELSSVVSRMPRLYQLQQQINLINKNWEILDIPHNIEGCQISFSQVVHERLRQLMKINPEVNKLDIKLSGDGTQIGKKLNLVQFSCTIIQEGSICKTSQGNHLVALFTGPEKYDRLKLALEDVVSEINQLKYVSIGDRRIPITYYLGGDYKFILAVLGIDNANCTYACCYCKIHKNDRTSTDQKWSMQQHSKESRTITDLQLCAARKHDKYNCSHEPLFPMIAINKVIVDLLHMFLRIGENLFKLLVNHAKVQDNLTPKKTFTKFDPIKYPNLNNLQTFINETCGIPFKWEVNNDTRQLKYRDFRGPELKMLFSKMDVKKCLPTFEYANEVQSIWTGFYNIYLSLHNDCMSDSEILEVDNKINTWFGMFTDMYAGKYVTPYIHILRCHVVEILNEHRSVSVYTQEGLEKLNDLSTTNYFSSTNRKGNAALQQLLLKTKRLEYYNDHEYARERSVRRCSGCGVAGHYRTTCTEQ